MLTDILREAPLALQTGLGIALLLLSWRFYAFTVRPWMSPSEPVVLPYWIPCHALNFFKSSDKMIEWGLEYTNYSRDPFSIQVLGTKFHIVTRPGDVTAVFRDSHALNFDGQLVRLLENFGVTPESTRKAWHRPRPGDWCHVPGNPVNPDQLDLIHLVEEVYRKQLLPGEHMDVMSRSFLDTVLAALTQDQIEARAGVVADDGGGPAPFLGTSSKLQAMYSDAGAPRSSAVSLEALCRYFVVEATTRSMFGAQLHGIEPDIVNIICEFNEHVWMVIFGYSPPWHSPVKKPQKKLMQVLERMIRLPDDKRGDECWAIRTVLQAMNIVDIDLESRAAMVLLTYWAAVSNEYNTIFWVLSYMLYDPSLFSRIREETEAAWRPDGALDLKHLCANSPLTSATLHEILRLNNGAAALRCVTEQTVVGGRVLGRGSMVLVPFRQLHNNREVWGATADDFDAERFLRQKGMARHASYRPFGGGATYCPGRTMAKEQVLGFVAVLLHRFDVRLARDGGDRLPFPRLNTTKPSLGVSGAVKGDDRTVIITPRQ